MIKQGGTLEISRVRLLHNVNVIRDQVGGAELCATIKADGYGHGMMVMGGLLQDACVQWACVYSLEEAMRLTQFAWEGILVMAPLVLTEGAGLTRDVGELLRGPIRVNITDARSAQLLSGGLESMGVKEPLNVHVQVDTGLTRMGVDAERAGELAGVIGGLSNLQLEGVFAHLSHGDVTGHETLREQLRVLRSVAEPLKERNPKLMVHLQNSGGAWNVMDAGMNMVRLGIAVYGLQASMTDRIEGLLPIARVTAPILAIHERASGVGVGYGHTFVTKRTSRLAVVPVGYAEGYPRSMSNRAVVQVRGMDAPVVGRVSMDQIIVDVTDVDGGAVGDEVMVISWDPEKDNCLDRMATVTGTIGYELATHFGSRLKRVIVD